MRQKLLATFALLLLAGYPIAYLMSTVSSHNVFRMRKQWFPFTDSTNKNTLVKTSSFEDLAEGKTSVLRFDGQQFERLYEFCTWTEPFHCSMVKTPVGRMPIYHHDPKTDHAMGAKLAKDGQRDEKEIGIIIRELENYPDAMFLDLGANIGIYTLTVAQTLGRRIIAVEPVVQNAVKLCKSIQENGLTSKVTMVFNPLSDTHSTVSMNTPQKHLSGSKVQSVLETPREAEEQPVCPGGTPYKTVLLDDLLPFMTSKTAVIKIDVESFEYNAFKGGQLFLDNIHVPAIFMEWLHVKHVPDCDLFVEMMKKRSYIAYDKDGKRLDYSQFLKWPWDVLWRKD